MSVIIEPVVSLSLGAGVQSSALALMASEGELLMPQNGIFADTQQEPASVYKWLSFLCGVKVRKRQDGSSYVDPGIYISGRLKFPIRIVTAGDIGEDTLRMRIRRDGAGSWVPSGIPHYSINADGSLGHGPRQCTHDFKIIPIEREQRRMIGVDRMRGWRKLHRSALREINKHRKELAEWKRKKKLGLDVGTAPLRPESA